MENLVANNENQNARLQVPTALSRKLYPFPINHQRLLPPPRTKHEKHPPIRKKPKIRGHRLPRHSPRNCRQNNRREAPNNNRLLHLRHLRLRTVSNNHQQNFHPPSRLPKQHLHQQQNPRKTAIKQRVTLPNSPLSGSKFIPYQEIRIQECSDQVPPGSIPRSFTVIAKGENTRKASPGDQVIIQGVFLPTQVDNFYKSNKQLIFDTHLEAFEITREKKKYVEFNITEDMMNRIDEQRKQNSPSEMYSKLARSIAPEIYGLEDVKKALLLLMSKYSELMKSRRPHPRDARRDENQGRHQRRLDRGPGNREEPALEAHRSHFPEGGLHDRQGKFERGAHGGDHEGPQHRGNHARGRRAGFGGHGRLLHRRVRQNGRARQDLDPRGHGAADRFDRQDGGDYHAQRQDLDFGRGEPALWEV